LMVTMKPTPRQYIRISVRVEKQIADALDEHAEYIGVKRATLVRMILYSYVSSLQRIPEPHPVPSGQWGMRVARGPIGGMSPASSGEKIERGGING